MEVVLFSRLVSEHLEFIRFAKRLLSEKNYQTIFAIIIHTMIPLKVHTGYNINLHKISLNLTTLMIIAGHRRLCVSIGMIQEVSFTPKLNLKLETLQISFGTQRKEKW